MVSDAADHLSIRSADRPRAFAGPCAGRRVAAPPADRSTLDLSAEISAGRATLDLSGARLDTLSLDVNAGDASLDLDGAAVSRLSVTVNAAKATVRLPATGDLTADLRGQRGLAPGLRAGGPRAAGPGRLLAGRHHLQRARPIG